jgi:ribokinase
MAPKPIVILGIFVADLAFRTPRLPQWGETVLGSGFLLGPGGKGSNQSVAAARLGARVAFISKVGDDRFGEMARHLYRDEGIDARFVQTSPTDATGAAAIILDQARGENAIIVVPGACDELTLAEIDSAEAEIAGAAIFLTQLETKMALVERGLALARRHGVPTILNPAPALDLPDHLLGMVDYLTPNESEAARLTGRPVESIEDAERAADALLARGARTVIVTLGAQGALVKNASLRAHTPAFDAGPVVETTGAGDAFNGGLAVALAEGKDPVAATRFGCAVAGLSVTRSGTAPSMPHRSEVDALMGAPSRPE